MENSVPKAPPQGRPISIDHDAKEKEYFTFSILFLSFVIAKEIARCS